MKVAKKIVCILNECISAIAKRILNISYKDIYKRKDAESRGTTEDRLTRQIDKLDAGEVVVVVDHFQQNRGTGVVSLLGYTSVPRKCRGQISIITVSVSQNAELLTSWHSGCLLS